MLLSLLLGYALGGEVFINGTRVAPSSVAGTTLQRVTITFDPSGNMLITAPGYTIETVQQPAPMPAATTQPTPRPTAAPPPPPNNGVTPARWWLVTEDNGSGGHTIEVRINGALVQTVQSGGAQKIIDVGRYLKLGANNVQLSANSVGATGGTLYVYLGTGSDQSGTVVMDGPVVQFGVGSTRSGAYNRDYNVNVDR